VAGRAELEARIRALEARLADVEAVQAIERLKARYAELVDRRMSKGRAREGEALARVADEIAELFTEDAVWDGGPALGVARGRDELRARMCQPTLRFSWHYFLKPRIEVSGDSAKARWDILSPCTTQDGRPHWMAGFEDDEYRCEAGVWRHARMKLTCVFLAPHDRGWERIFY
jgi:hypothetical protein